MDDPARKHARVLVVDDELSLAETLADGLVDRGYQASALATSRLAAGCCVAQTGKAPATATAMARTIALCFSMVRSA